MWCAHLLPLLDDIMLFGPCWLADLGIVMRWTIAQVLACAKGASAPIGGVGWRQNRHAVERARAHLLPDAIALALADRPRRSSATSPPFTA